MHPISGSSGDFPSPGLQASCRYFILEAVLLQASGLKTGSVPHAQLSLGNRGSLRNYFVEMKANSSMSPDLPHNARPGAPGLRHYEEEFGAH